MFTQIRDESSSALLFRYLWVYTQLITEIANSNHVQFKKYIEYAYIA